MVPPSRTRSTSQEKRPMRRWLQGGTLFRGDGAITVDMNCHLWQGAGRRSVKNATSLSGVKDCSMSGTDQQVPLRVVVHQHTAVCTSLLVGDKRSTGQMDQETLPVLSFTWLIKCLSRVEGLTRVSNDRASSQ